MSHMKDAKFLIEQLVEWEDALRRALEEKEAIRQRIIPPEVAAELKALDKEFEHGISVYEENVEIAKAAAKAAVLRLGETVQTSRYRFAYVAKSGGWDGKKLEQLVASLALVGNTVLANAILDCRKPDGKPYVQVADLKKE